MMYSQSSPAIHPQEGLIETSFVQYPIVDCVPSWLVLDPSSFLSVFLKSSFCYIFPNREHPRNHIMVFNFHHLGSWYTGLKLYLIVGLPPTGLPLSVIPVWPRHQHWNFKPLVPVPTSALWTCQLALVYIISIALFVDLWLGNILLYAIQPTLNH